MSEAAHGFSPEKVKLTSMEKRLLDVLQARPGHVYSRKELLDAIMPDAIVLERTVDVHIRALRKKLGAGSRIRTIHGLGYVWN
jgi:two-component system, OmpR family, phosphate regulon response regulator PhoB